MSYRIPRSKLWTRLRDGLKPALRRAVGARLYHELTERWYFATVFVNYVFIKKPWLRRRFKTGVWSFTICVEGTNICNAKCVFCAYPQMERPKQTMPMEHFKSVIAQWVALGGDEADLTPIVGDPFVDKHIFERLDHLRDEPRIRRFHFFTNAILMKPEQWDRLCGYGERLTVYMSFGGFDRETYHKVMGVDKFDEAVANIKGVIEAKRRLGSRINLQLNLRSPLGSARGELWDWLEARRAEGLLVIDGIDAFDLWSGALKEEDLAAAGLKSRPKLPRQGPCYRLIGAPTMLADGRVNACAARDIEAELVIGDLKTESLAEVLSGDKLLGLIEAHDRGEMPPVCRRCNYYTSIYPGWMRGRLFPLFHWLFR